MSYIVKPPKIGPNSVIGVIAPSDSVEKETLEESFEILKSWGLKVKVGKHVYSKVGDFMAGTPEERMEDLKDFIYDANIDVIWASNGGYAATEVLPVFTKETMVHLKNHPKWFIGYSDVCMLLNALTSYKMVNIMGPTLWGLPEWDEVTRSTIRNILFGDATSGIGPNHNWSVGVAGSGLGRIVVADLETLIFSFGTRFDPLMYGSGPVILGLEELDIEKSTLQRQIDVILAHKRAGRITGIFVGRLVNIREQSYPEWGKDFTPEDIITTRVKKWGNGKIPVGFCADFGHAEWDYEAISPEQKLLANRTFLSIPNGIKAKLNVSNNNCSLEYLESIAK